MGSLENLNLLILEIYNVGASKRVEKILIRNGDDLINGYSHLIRIATHEQECYFVESTKELLKIRKELCEKTIEIIESNLNKNLTIQEAYEKTKLLVDWYLSEGQICRDDICELRPFFVNDDIGEKYGLTKEEFMNFAKEIFFLSS